MFLKSLSLYGGFRLFTMLASLLQIFIINKKFGVSGYGEITLLLAYSVYINIFVFQWLSKVTARFSNDIQLNKALLSIHLLFGLLLILITLPFTLWFNYITLIVLIAFVDSFKEHLLEYFRSNLKVKEYGVFNFIYSLTSISFLIIILGLPIDIKSYLSFYYIINMFLILIYIIKFKLVIFDLNIFSKVSFIHCKYGYSISLSNSISQFAFSGIRIIIGKKFGNEVLGIFSIIYDILQRSLVAYMQIINSAIFPLMRNSWDNKKIDLLKKYIRINYYLLAYIPFLILLVAISFIDYFILVLNINESLIDFNIKLMTYIIGVGVVINRIKTFHLDYFLIFFYKTSIIFSNTLISMFFLAVSIFLLRNDNNLIYINISVTFAYFISFILSYIYVYKCFIYEIKDENIISIILISKNERVLSCIFLTILFFISVLEIKSEIWKVLLILILSVLIIYMIISSYKKLKKEELNENKYLHPNV